MTLPLPKPIGRFLSYLYAKRADGAARRGDWPRASQLWKVAGKLFGTDLHQARQANFLRYAAAVGARCSNLEDFRREIEAYRRFRQESSGSHNPKIAVFTTISGDYDSLKLPLVLDPRFDFFVFANGPIVDSGVYRARTLDYCDKDNTRASRYPKMHPHVLLRGYDVAVYIDANIVVLGDIFPIVEGFLASKCAFGAIPHPRRSSLREEANACIELGKDDRTVIEEQLRLYESLRFEAEDLIECNLLMFDLRNDRLARFLEIWWLQINRYSRRDQLSVNFALRQADVSCLPEILPTYAVLFPLLKEAEIIGQLIEGLCRIDYPADRLQISLIVEEDDTCTQSAIARHMLPDHMRVVVVPQGEPRTKPRALNHALADASGAYVVVYDAEDLPNPGQLREALAVLVSNSETTGCVKARLNVYNADSNAITRQFALEYSALFGAVLPTLDRLGLPIPLGGTSNHFPRRVLEQVGGWDPYNVTEDADLGIRLARLGYDVRVIPSTTLEEAPESLRVWIRQRTRWLKGWMQTYLVHVRHPRRLWRELGTYRFLGFQMMLGGMILSALVHPWFLIMLCYASFSWEGMASNWLMGFGTFNLIAGYGTAMALGAMAVVPQNRRLAWSVLAMPVYWIAISCAAYLAVWQLIWAPFFWEKTPHYGRRSVPIRDATASPIDD